MKKNFVYIFSFVLLYTVILVFNHFQTLSQHWSSIIDFDLTVIFNSLQIISGEEQDFREHPGYTQFLVYGIFFKFFLFFDNSIIRDVDSLIQLKNINESLDKLFLIARFANAFFFILTIFFFSKICKLFKIKNELIFFGAISLAISKAGIDNLLILRADIIAVTFMLGSIYYILSFIKQEQKIYKLLISSFFLVLSLLAKIQIIILLFFVLAIIPFLIKNEIDKNFNKEIILKYFNFYLIFYILIFISYLFLQFFIYQHNRFEDQNYIDIFVFIFFNIVYFTYLLFVNINKKNLIKITLSILVLLILGVILSLGFLLLLSYLEIFKLSPYILMRLTNPFYYLKVYSPLSVSKIEFNFLIEFASTMLSGLIVDIKSLLILIIISIYSMCNDLFKNKINNFEYKLILLISIIVIFFSFNFRYFYTYDMYYLPFYYLLILLCLKDFKKSYLIISVIVVFLINNQFFFEKFNYLSSTFERDSNLTVICSNEETRKFLSSWAKKLDENFFKDMCIQEKIKFLN